VCHLKHAPACANNAQASVRVLAATPHPKNQKTLFKKKNKIGKAKEKGNSTALVYKNTSTLIAVNPLLGMGQVSTVLTASRAAQVVQTTHDP